MTDRHLVGPGPRDRRIQGPAECKHQARCRDRASLEHCLLPSADPPPWVFARLLRHARARLDSRLHRLFEVAVATGRNARAGRSVASAGLAGRAVDWLGDRVPPAVQMGYHLCYGSPADEHLVMPRDMAVMVEMANGIRQAVARRVDFLHMPVPKDRTDAAYVRPLAELAGFEECALYLGLIHHDDREGDLARIKAARDVADVFGVASECGWGRTDPQRVPGLLESHRAAVQLMTEVTP